MLNAIHIYNILSKFKHFFLLSVILSLLLYIQGLCSSNLSVKQVTDLKIIDRNLNFFYKTKIILKY